MNDLIRAFFERDLTEIEKDALGELLKKSPEASQEFSAYAEKKYAATGLPDPKWPHSTGWTVPTSVKVAGVLFFAATVALLTVKGPEMLSKGKCEPASAVDLSALPDDGVTAPVVRNVRAKSAPESFVEGKKYTGLLAVVDKSAPAAARVRVVDAAGREVCVLYDGMLPKGTWVFRWDGRTSRGTAPAGSYTIEVLSSGTTLRSPVQLGPH